MKSSDTISQLERRASSGWAICAYDHHRRLLFTLNPSHGWAILAGIILGGGMALFGFTLKPPDSVASTAPETTPMTAPLQLD